MSGHRGQSFYPGKRYQKHSLWHSQHKHVWKINRYIYLGGLLFCMCLHHIYDSASRDNYFASMPVDCRWYARSVTHQYVTVVHSARHPIIQFNRKAVGHFDGLVQERRNSIANALELRLSCTNPSIYYTQFAENGTYCKETGLDLQGEFSENQGGHLWVRDGGYKANFLHSFSRFFFNYQDTGYLWNIIFISDRCCCSCFFVFFGGGWGGVVCKD